MLIGLVSGCGFLDPEGCAPKPVAAVSKGVTHAPLWAACARIYEANGQTWYVWSGGVYLTDAALAVLEPAGRIERAGGTGPVEDSALYSLPGVDPTVALVHPAAGDDPKLYELLYPSETELTSDVCPFLEPEPAIPGDSAKPGTGIPAGATYEEICGAASLVSF